METNNRVAYAVPVVIQKNIFKHKYKIYYKCCLCWKTYFILKKDNNFWYLEYIENNLENESKKYKFESNKKIEDIVETLKKLGVKEKVFFKLQLINESNNDIIFKKTIYALNNLIASIYETELNLEGVEFI